MHQTGELNRSLYTVGGYIVAMMVTVKAIGPGILVPSVFKLAAAQ